MPVQVPETMKRIVHFGSRNYGQLTASRRMLPQFLICGGQRCGTTSLYRALAAHPAVIKAVLHKGVHYFDVGYHHGLRWYRGHFPLQRRAERVRAEFGVPAQTFESSPYYMYHPHALARIAADLPGVRLVVLVRDPVERAYSQHAHEVARGFEPEVDFAKALELERERLDGQRDKLIADPFAYSFPHQHHAYRARGEYIEYIEPMAKLLGRDRIHVIDSSEFFERPEPVYDAVVEFLGLPHVNSYPLFDRHNARPRNRLDDSIAQQLAAHYEPYDERLATFLGHKPSWMQR
ncbi:sulfotransferase domain-containing protein [Dactylosporangium sp. NPDC051541]|uniref:sulfotransferase domain-containing protein n=1 Tax=Dactylosporangium sp. NPDC051541 TaxID=3363977 RepID=UPI0037B9CDAA